ncbi:MAG: ABC transporter ATP-binding protein [Armatimonadota bacterium]
MEYAIQTHELTRSFGSLIALNDLNLQVPQGTVFGVLGPNGAGKTTMIRLLLGLLRPTSGKAEVLGYDISTQSHQIRQYTGALLEHDGLYERTSAEHNLMFWGRACRMSSSDIRSRIQIVLELFGLYERRKDILGEWSRGMKRKLAVARALMNEPNLLFLDEPTSGLDPVSAAEMRHHLSDIVNQQGVTVFLNTHNLAEAEQLCQQIAVLSSGRLLACDTPENIRRSASSNEVLITGSDWPDMAMVQDIPGIISLTPHPNGHLQVTLEQGAGVAPLIKELVMAGASIEEVRRDTASLEQALLTLVEGKPNGA